MRKIVVGACIGAVIGTVFGITVLTPNLQKHAALRTIVEERALTADTPANLPRLTPTADALNWRTTAPYPSDRPQVLALAQEFSKSLASLTADQIILPAQSTKDVIKGEDIFNAVASGRIDAVFATAEVGQHVEPALALFDALPFAPNPRDYLNWLQAGTGTTHLQDLFSRHNIHAQVCGYLPAQSAGFFVKEFNNSDDLQRLRMRPNSRLAAKVLSKAGVQVVDMPAQEVPAALEEGRLDAVSFSSPAIDAQTDFAQYAPVYYYPGWHNQGQPLLLLITNKTWRTLDNQRRHIIRSACSTHTTLSFARASQTEFDGLSSLSGQGTVLKKLPSYILDTFEGAWQDVLSEEIRGNQSLLTIWQDLESHLKTQQAWYDMGYKQAIGQDLPHATP